MCLLFEKGDCFFQDLELVCLGIPHFSLQLLSIKLCESFQITVLLSAGDLMPKPAQLIMYELL